MSKSSYLPKSVRKQLFEKAVESLKERHPEYQSDNNVRVWDIVTWEKSDISMEGIMSNYLREYCTCGGTNEDSYTAFGMGLWYDYQEFKTILDTLTRQAQDLPTVRDILQEEFHKDVIIEFCREFPSCSEFYCGNWWIAVPSKFEDSSSSPAVYAKWGITAEQLYCELYS